MQIAIGEISPCPDPMLCNRKYVDVLILRSVVGLWVWGALLFRDLLSIPAIIFRFMDQYEGQVTPWWPSDERPQSCPTVATASESL